MVATNLIKKNSFVFAFFFTSGLVFSQKSIIKIDKSPYAKLHSVGLDIVIITGGFWKNRQEVNRNTSLKILWDRATNEEYGYSLSNFEIASGLKEEIQQGVAWQDAWIYKWIEAASYEAASTADEKLLERIDEVVPGIAKAQADDGYIATQVQAGKFSKRWMSPSHHEMHNMVHLLTAAAVNYRMTSQTGLLDVANKAAAFCLKQFREHPEIMREYPLNPSIIMGAVELYRATGNKDGLELTRHTVDLRGSKYQPEKISSNWGRPEWGEKEQCQGGKKTFGQYQDITEQKTTPVDVELIPYYAWNNRKEPKMSVWLPVVK